MDNSMPTSIQLRQYIRSVLVEKAITPAQATKQDLALYIGRISDQRLYVLYDPTKFEAALRRNLIPSRDSGIIAVMRVELAQPGRAWNAATVGFAAAEQGYGPLLYDIVMANEKGLMPDRRSVRPAAKKVWQYYLKNRADITAKPLDNIGNPKTEPTIDDAIVHRGGSRSSLNYAYFTKKKPNIAQLRKNHADAMKRFRKYKFDVRQFTGIAIDYFDLRY